MRFIPMRGDIIVGANSAVLTSLECQVLAVVVELARTLATELGADKAPVEDESTEVRLLQAIDLLEESGITPKALRGYI